MFTILGTIALFVIGAYIAGCFGMLAFFCFIGFDEVNIPAGLVLLVPAGLGLFLCYLALTPYSISMNG